MLEFVTYKSLDVLSQYTIVQYSTKQYNSLFAQKHQKPNRTHMGGGLGVPGVGYNLDLLFFIKLIVF